MMNLHGTDPAKWPDSPSKDYLRIWIRINLDKELDQCIFAKNLHGKGVFNSPDDAKSIIGKLDPLIRR